MPPRPVCIPHTPARSQCSSEASRPLPVSSLAALANKQVEQAEALFKASATAPLDWQEGRSWSHSVSTRSAHAQHSPHKFSKFLHIVTSYRKYTRALTIENLWKARQPRPRTDHAAGTHGARATPGASCQRRFAERVPAAPHAHLRERLQQRGESQEITWLRELEWSRRAWGGWQRRGECVEFAPHRCPARQRHAHHAHARRAGS